MPQIATFEAPQGLGLRPTERGIESTAAAARRVGAEYNEAAGSKAAVGHMYGSAIAMAGEVAVKAIDHAQISQGANAFASLINAKTKEWDEISKKADPNDPTVAQKFIEGSLNPDLEKFKGGFITENGQRWAESHVDQFRQHMFAKTSADMSSAAGQAVAINHRKTINNLASAAYSDPSSLDFSLRTLDSTTDGVVGSSPNLTGAKAAQVKGTLLQEGKEAIVKSAIMGMIERDPNVDLSAVQKKYGQYITGPEILQFQKAAKAQAKANLLTQKQIETYQHQQDVRAADTQFSQIWTDNVSFDENGKPTIKPGAFKDILEVEKKYPGVATERAKTMINWLQSQQKEKHETIVTDKAVQTNLYDGLFRTDNPTTDVDILKAEYQGKLNPHDRSVLMNLYKAMEERPLKGPLYQTAMDAVKEKVGVNVVPNGHSNYAQFMQQFIPAYLALSEKERIGALDTSNPNSLISKIIGTKPGEGLQPTVQERLMGRAERAMGNVEMTPEMLKAFGGQTPKKETPPDNIASQYPDAYKGSDGRWRVNRNGQVMIIKETK